MWRNSHFDQNVSIQVLPAFPIRWILTENEWAENPLRGNMKLSACPDTWNTNSLNEILYVNWNFPPFLFSTLFSSLISPVKKCRFPPFLMAVYLLNILLHALWFFFLDFQFLSLYSDVSLEVCCYVWEILRYHDYPKGQTDSP